MDPRDLMIVPKTLFQFVICADWSNSIGTLPALPLSSTLFNRFLTCRTVERLKLFLGMDISTAAMNSECKSSNRQATGNLSPSLFALKFESNERSFPHILTDFDSGPACRCKMRVVGSCFFFGFRRSCFAKSPEQWLKLQSWMEAPEKQTRGDGGSGPSPTFGGGDALQDELLFCLKVCVREMFHWRTLVGGGLHWWRWCLEQE